MPDIIHFPQGIPGFETHRDFQLIVEEQTHLAQLISQDDNLTGFVLVQPQAFFSDYLQTNDIDEESSEVLKATPDSEIQVWAILTLNSTDVTKTTVNLKAPLLINPAAKTGVQMILNDERYLSRTPLFAGESYVQDVREGAVG